MKIGPYLYLYIKTLGFLLTLIPHIIVYASSNKVLIHTEDRQDMAAFVRNDYAHNLSTATNLLALKHSRNKIQFEYMTTKRSLLLMEKNSNICIVNKVKTKERLEKYIYSKPVNLFLGRRLYQHASAPPLTDKLSENGVDLISLFFIKPNAKLIVSGQISYGDYLDNVIKQLHSRNLFVRESGEHDTGIISMLEKGRMEFALVYPHQVYELKSGINARSYEIANVAPFILGYLMCNKTTDTLSLLKTIDLHLSQPETKKQLLELQLEFVNPTEQAAFSAYFDESFN